jgi:hypothetical protein
MQTVRSEWRPGNRLALGLLPEVAEGGRPGVARPKRIQSVFLNIPYDEQFEDLYLAYVVGLTQLGLTVNATPGCSAPG